MRFANLILLFLTITLHGCATQASTRTQFTSSSSDALVVIGVKSNVGPYGVTFLQLDPDTCQPNPLSFGKSFSHNTPFSPTAYKAGKLHYILASFEPGTWILSGMSYEFGVTRILKYESGTLAFTAHAGEFIYLGDIEFEKQGFRFKGHNHKEMQAHLAKYPDVNVVPTDHPRWITPYGKSGPVEDCNKSRH